jgi:hypothetical protein
MTSRFDDVVHSMALGQVDGAFFYQTLSLSLCRAPFTLGL